MTEILEELIKEYIKNEISIPVCSFPNCRKVRIQDRWFKLTYYPNYKHYTHGCCPECKETHYGINRKTNHAPHQ